MKKKILFISIKYYDAEKNKGRSYEYNNFYLNLKKYFNISHLPIDEIIQKNGYDYLNDKILKIHRNYDILFFFMYKNDIYPSTLKVIKNNKKIKSIAWMSDDHWRFNIYSRKYVGYFDLIVTTCSNAFQKYKKLNQKAYLGFWATDDTKIKKNNNSKYTISFIGKKYGNRAAYIKFLKQKNFFVKCFGHGWEKKSFFLGDIKNVFIKSDINLNFSESSTGLSFKNILKVFIYKKTNGWYLFNNPLKYILYFKTFCLSQSKQIKGRLFEIVSSKSFVLTEYQKDLHKFFDLKKEIDCFKNKDDLLKKLNFYKKNQNVIYHMRNRAYKKFKKKYTIQLLFKKIFNEVSK